MGRFACLEGATTLREGNEARRAQDMLPLRQHNRAEDMLHADTMVLEAQKPLSRTKS